MENHPDSYKTPEESTPQSHGRYKPLSKNSLIIQMALKGSCISLSILQKNTTPNPNIKEKNPPFPNNCMKKNSEPAEKLHPTPPFTPEEEEKFKEEVKGVLKDIFGEESLKNETNDSSDPKPFTSFEVNPFPFGQNELDLINEVLYRVQKGFLALQINEHEIFSQEMLFELLKQIANPVDRLELLSNSLLPSFAHMAVNPEGEENVIHVLDLATPPQKVLGDLPFLYVVKWHVYQDGVSIEKESEYVLVTPVKNEPTDLPISLYIYQEVIDFREGQEKHSIHIEPSTRAFDPIHHRLIWGPLHPD
jgi:hypothetical protein